MSEKTKECPGCALEVPSDSEICPYCGYEFPSNSRWLPFVAVGMIALMLLWFVGC
ncbi:MAG: hypothetical protein KDD65_01880 [Bacteroidetes bacterium]|nr:hypothetical protein [Bacteroidota bacterium]